MPDWVSKKPSNNEIVRRSTSELDLRSTKSRLISLAQEQADLLRLPEFEFEVVKIDTAGTIIRRENMKNKFFREDLGNGIFLDMVYIPGGRFKMGSPREIEDMFRKAKLTGYLHTLGLDDRVYFYNLLTETPQRWVSLSSFYMGRFPVTQAQWRAVSLMPQVERQLDSDPSPSRYKGDDLPVHQVSWYEAVEFCNRLTTHTGHQYRLPSEAEWEYACRAGTTTQFHFGDAITAELANYSWKYNWNPSFLLGSPVYKGSVEDMRLTPVGSFGLANSFGLSDMHGNVREWCADYFQDSYVNAPIDGTPWIDEPTELTAILTKGETHVVARSCWSDDPPRHCRSACRYHTKPNTKTIQFGFRLTCI